MKTLEVTKWLKTLGILINKPVPYGFGGEGLHFSLAARALSEVGHRGLHVGSQEVQRMSPGRPSCRQQGDIWIVCIADCLQKVNLSVICK